MVDPCIPASWDGFKVTREFREARYNIEVQNPDHICKGVKKVIMDGREIDGNILPVSEKGSEHNVIVVMG
jgi:cellobiose phosphorylase